MTRINGILFLCTSFALSIAAAEPTPPPAGKEHLVPATVYVHFPRSVQIETFYIYPLAIAFRARSGLTPKSKLLAEFDDLGERPTYHRTVECHYLRDDDTFWVDPPRDLPPEVSVTFRLLPQRPNQSRGCVKSAETKIRTTRGCRINRFYLCRECFNSQFGRIFRPPTTFHTANRSSQPLAVVMCSVDFMKHVQRVCHASLSASGGSACSR